MDSRVDPKDPGTARTVVPLFPWETGVTGSIFGTAVASGGLGTLLSPVWSQEFIRASLRPSIEEPAPALDEVADDPPVSASGPAYQLIGRKRKTVPWAQGDDKARAAAICKWKLIVELFPDASRLGRQLKAVSELPDRDERVHAILEDSFADKATRTISGRAGSVMQFLRWCEVFIPGIPALPMREEHVYRYLEHLHMTKAPATRGQRFLEAAGFMHGVIGCPAQGILDSRRCRGASLRSFRTKRLLLQRDPLELSQVAGLENSVFDAESEVDQIFAGFCAFMVHARGRFSDGYKCVSEPKLDVSENGRGFVEVSVTETKTSNRKARRRRALPMVALSLGVTGRPWAARWLQLRLEHGLDSTDGPLMPAVSSSGKWTEARLKSSEAVIWMAELLSRAGAPVRSNQVIGTHSGKATLLSWLAKAGASIEDRKVLGYHTSSKEEVALLYSRDALAGPLLRMEQLIEKVRLGLFRPDETRSGRWVAEGSLREVHSPVVEALQPWEDFVVVSPMQDVPPSPGVVSNDSDWIRGRVVSEAEPSEPLPESVGTDCCREFRRGYFVWKCDDCGLEGCTSCVKLEPSHGKLLCGTCVAVATQADQDLQVLIELDDSSQSSSSESSGDSSDGGAERLARLFAPRRPCRNASGILVQHKKWSTLHFMHESIDGRLACGRAVSECHKVLGDFRPRMEWPRCSTCFGAEPLEDGQL